MRPSASVTSAVCARRVHILQAAAYIFFTGLGTFITPTPQGAFSHVRAKLPSCSHRASVKAPPPHPTKVCGCISRSQSSPVIQPE